MLEIGPLGEHALPKILTVENLLHPTCHAPEQMKSVEGREFLNHGMICEMIEGCEGRLILFEELRKRKFFV